MRKLLLAALAVAGCHTTAPLPPADMEAPAPDLARAPDDLAQAPADLAMAQPTCFDGTKNGDETDVDCGGACPPCAVGGACVAGADCASGVCAGGKCLAPTCMDLVKNGKETDVDCGGGVCPACAVGKTCAAGADCTSGVCAGGKCAAPTCMDKVKNGTETDVDCGGGNCPACAVGKACAQPADCATGACCGNLCVDLASDAPNCGACGHACGNGIACALGRCGLYAWYKLDEGQGNVIVDSVAGANGTLSGAVWAAGKKGTALQFDGTTYASVPAGKLTYGANGADFTVEMWLQVTVGPTGQYRNVYHHGTTDMDRTTAGWLNTGTLQVNEALSIQGNYNDVLQTSVMQLNTWTHFAIVRQGQTRTLYINGVSVASNNNAANVVANSGPLYLGKDPFWPGMSGLLDDFRIYVRALSPAEIMADMQ